MRIQTFLVAAVMATTATAVTEARMAKQNIVVQSYEEAMSNNIFEPGFNQEGYDARLKETVKEPEKESLIAVSAPEDKTKNYNKEIAAELFQSNNLSPVSIEILEKQNDIGVAIGQPLQVILPHVSNAFWSYDKKFKYVEITDDYEFQGQRILNFKSKTKGVEKVFFDLFSEKDGKISVIESRALNITAGQ